MIRIKSLTAKNFMSIGNATQSVAFDRADLTLVLGENLDLGGNGSRNGVGKTSLLNALSYALYGQAISNIKRDNLINGTNKKGMLVSLDFEVNGTSYRIERGRRPNVLRFFINDKEQENDDNAQGDSRQTQEFIDRLLGMSHDMFRHVVALNTYTEPFLSLRANDQRQIIEQLLGITMLSEKAAKVKELVRTTKETQQEEEFRIKAVQEANKRVVEQIESLKRRQALWYKKRDEDVASLSDAIEGLSHVNIEDELKAHDAKASYDQKSSLLNTANDTLLRLGKDLDRSKKSAEKITKELADLADHKCYACGQPFHDEKHQEVVTTKTEALSESTAHIASVEAEILETLAQIKDIGGLGDEPTTFYKTREDAINHRYTLEVLERDLLAKNNETNPYTEQIEEMEKRAIQVVSYDRLNDLSRILDHQEFLLKLLTNKDSFIRKKIIEQNLSYLNARLTYYLDRIGLPHTVTFLNDLSVEITELGRDLDFDNLSRGERNRLILSLSWAFRDVWESLYSPINLLFIDELIDAGMDSTGVEAAMGLLKKMSRERQKSIWLVSHRDELSSRVENIMKVIKENGFTTFCPEEE